MKRKNITFTPKQGIDSVELDGILHDGRVITYMHADQALIFAVNEEDVQGFLIKLGQYGSAEIVE